ncbi:MAG: hypothetical protein WKF84_27460 [Pyrinomonadaceae bacterium]
MFASLVHGPTVAAQLRIKIPGSPKIGRPNPELPKNEEGRTASRQSQMENRSPVSGPSGGELKFLQRPVPTNNPVFLKSTLDISCETTSHYWKTPNGSINSNWIPKVKFSAFLKETKARYAVEYFNPDGSLWYGEPMEQIGAPISGNNWSVLVESERASDKHQGKSTTATGTYGVKITNTRNNETVFQGKFKVGKFKTADTSPTYRNQYNFFVEQDWNIPIGYVWLNYAFSDTAPRVCVSMWFKGGLSGKEFEARLYHNGQEIGSTDNGGLIGSEETRYSTIMENETTHHWLRYDMSWVNFVALADPDAEQQARFDKKRIMQEMPGEYTVKVFYKGAQVREAKFIVDPDGMLVDNGIAKQNNFDDDKIIVPVKIIGALDKWNAATWKTDAFTEIRWRVSVRRENHESK